MTGTMARYTNEMRERAVRMFAEVRSEHLPRCRVAAHGGDVAGLLGMSTETLRLWVNRAQIDAVKRTGTTSEDAKEIKRAQREVADHSRANEILKSASVPFAKGARPPTTR